MSEDPGAGEAPIVVIGAGIVGLAIAFRLARLHPRVVLVDRGDPGMGCSYGNAGHIATEQVFPLASPDTMLNAPRLLTSANRPLSLRGAYAHRIAPWLLRFAWASRPTAFRRGTAALSSLQTRALDALQTLCNDAGLPGQIHRRGHLILVENPKLAAAAQEQIATFLQHGIDAVWLPPQQVLDFEPALVSNIGAIHVRHSGHVSDPLQLSLGLLEAFQRAGGEFLRDEVLAIERGGDQLRLRLTSGELRASRIVLAAGAWSRPLAAQTGFDVPLDTERGYHVIARDWKGKLDIAVASMDRMTIMTPLASGLRITGFVELGGLDLPRNPHRLARLNRHLSELLPGAEMNEREEWMGFRPSLPDHLPVIGKHPADERILYAFGHQHLGLTLAGVTAELIAALSSGAPLDIDLSPFRINRF